MPERPPGGRSLAGWALGVLGVHALVLLGLDAASGGGRAEAERTARERIVVGQLNLADPVVAGPAGAALGSPDVLAQAPPAPAEALHWVPVPEPSLERAREREADPAPHPPSRAERRFDRAPAAQPARDANPPVGPAPEPLEAIAPPPPTPTASQADRSDAPALGGTLATAAAPASPSGAEGASRSASAASGSTDAAPATDLPPFEWPPSTRLRYHLTGQYRGDIEGQAQVEWHRDGDRYAVRLDIRVGVAIAPLMSRRMASEGRLTSAGLVPERYDERTRVGLREPREATMRLGPDGVRLADGRWVSAPAGVQDTASQFIQLAYRFSTEAGLLEAGRTVDLPLALPRRVDGWVYDVIGPEWLDTPFGRLEAVHLRPRPVPRAGEVLTAEIWFAPRLRHLPVRIRIQQGPEVFVDLMIDRLPDLLAPVLAPAPPAGPAFSPAASR